MNCRWSLANGSRSNQTEGFSRTSTKSKFLIALAEAKRMIDILLIFG
jgi:hypothetical protein